MLKVQPKAGQVRKRNDANRRNLHIAVSERGCLVCGHTPCDPHHYPVRASHGGKDSEDNLVPLCRLHHSAFHDGDEWVIDTVRRNAEHYFRLYASR